MRNAALAVAFVLAGASPLLAQEDTVDCDNAQTQMDMNICSEQEFAKADAELNAIWKDVVESQREVDKGAAEMDPVYVGAVKALKQAQRGWIDYRDGQCAGEGYQAVGGSMQPMLISSCKAALTNKRIAELKELMKGMDN